MSKTEIIQAIRDYANANGTDSAKMTYGPAGEYVDIPGIGKEEKGQAWEEDEGDESAQACFVGGVANWIGTAFGVLMPVGSILAYAGALPPPAGWKVCDGTEGTPDLRDRFLRGAEAAGATGGSDTASHSHSIDHDHPSTTSGAPSQSTYVPATPNEAQVATNVHTHDVDISYISGASGSSAPDNKPPYYEVVFIIKTA